MAFFGGSTGVIYRQFSVTIVSAMVLSVLVALILTPALCATMLKPIDKEHHENKQGFFGNFNRKFEHFSLWIRSQVGELAMHGIRALVIYAVIIGGIVWGFKSVPQSFMPAEDQGALLIQMKMAPNVSQQRSEEVLERVTKYFQENEAENVFSVFTVSGFSFGGSGQNMGLAFVKLKDWDERKRADQKDTAVAGRAMRTFMQWNDAQVYAFPLPPVPELGLAEGFDMYLQASAGQSHEELMQTRNMFLGMANQHPSLAMVRPNGMEDTPHVTPGNIHDSVAFDDLYEEICNYYPEHQTVVADSAYKTPHICKEVFETGRILSSAYKRPNSKREGYRTYEYVYDEFYDCVICPENQVLHYSTTNREGYREYKSCSCICKTCPTRSKCTENAKFEKTVTRHLWQDWVELAEDARHTPKYKALYKVRQEKIERVFADAKEKHGMRYTNYRGLTQVTNWVKLKFAAMNLKKLATWKWKRQKGGVENDSFPNFVASYLNFYILQRANPILV